MKLLTRFFLATFIAALSLGGRAEAQSTSTWANSNVTGTPVSLLDWFTGGANPQGTWTGGDPASNSATTIQFFENTTTALTNTATPSSQTVNLNNGGSAFELGTLTLSGLASATADANLTMTLSGDALNFSAATGTINLNALNATRTITYNVNNNIQLGTASSASALTIGGDGTGTFVLGGIISELQAGGGSLIKTGNSAVSLTGSNTFSGGVTLNAGTLRLGNAAALGTGTLTIAGGSLDATSAVTLNNNAQNWNGNFTFVGSNALNLGAGAVSLGAATRTVTVSANTLTVGGVISGGGAAVGLTKAGAGTLVLAGANIYSGNTTLNAGQVNLNSATAIGTGTLVFNGGTLGNTSGAAITLSSNNTQNWNQNFTFAGPYDLNLGTGAVVINATSRTVTVSSNTLSVGGAISGGNSSTALTKAGAGTLSLGGANTYSGGTWITGGTLVLDYSTQNNSKLSDTTVLTLEGGGLVIKEGSHTETVGSTRVRSGGSTISRDGGTGVLQLNAFTRDIHGTLVFGEASIATTDTLNVNGILGGWATIGDDWAVNSTNAADGAITALSSYTGALPTATGATTANYTLTGNQTQTGSVDANTLKITGSGTLQLNSSILKIRWGGNADQGGILYAGGPDDNYTIANGRVQSTFHTTELIFQANSGTLTVDAFVIGAHPTSASGPVTKNGAGTLVLGAANTFIGAVRVNQGTLRLTNATAAGTTAGGITVQNGAALELANAIEVGAEALSITGAGVSSGGALRNIASNTSSYAGAITIGTGGASITSDSGGALTLTGGVVTAAGRDVTFGGAGDTTISTTGISGAGQVVKDGAGALTLQASGHAGAFRMNAGRLNVNVDSAFGSAASLSLAAGVTLDNSSAGAVTVNNATLATTLGSSLTFLGTQNLSLGTGPTTLTATSAIAVNSGTLTFGGNVGDGGNAYGITKSGAGTLVLSGLTGSAFTGNSVVSGGELYLSGTSTLGGTVATTVTVQTGATLRVGPTASKGAVTLLIDGGQVLYESLQDGPVDFTANSVLNNSNAFANGVQTIAAGVVVSSAEDWIGSIPGTATQGRIVMENGAVLRSTQAINIAANKGIELAGASATFDADTGSIVINSQVTGTGALVKTGTGGFRILNTGNTYSGGTEIREGTFGIYGDGSLGQAGTRVLIDGAILNSGQGTSGQTVTVESARSIVLGNGKTSNLDATNGSTLAYAGVITEENAEGAAANLRIGTAGFRSGLVLLGGANTYRGDTIINAGTLKLGGGGSFANSQAIVVGDAGSNGAVFDLTEKSTFAIGAGQTLKGKGTVLLGENTTVTINGLLSPGNSPGLLTWSGSGSVALSGTTLMEVWGTSRGANPGYDAINLVNGTDLTFGGILQLDFNQLFADGTSFNLFTPDGTSTLAGTFSSITMVGSSYTDLTFTNNAGFWTTNTGAANQSMTFNSSTGILSIAIAVPEPSTLTLAGLGLAAAAFASRRRRRCP